MGLVRITEQNPARGAQWSVDEKGTWTRSYDRVFIVDTDDPNTSDTAVLRLAGVAPLYSSHPFDPLATLVSKQAQQVSGTRLQWLVTLRYSTRAPDPSDRTVEEEQLEEEQNDDPTERRNRISYGTIQYTRAIEQDVNGKPITNSAGQKFDPATEIELALLTLQIECWRKPADFAPRDIARDFLKHTNENAVTIREQVYAAKTLFLYDVQAQEEFEKKQRFFHVHWTLHYNPDGWKVRRLDEGTLEADVIEGVNYIHYASAPKAILDDRKLPVAGPVLLKQGHRLPLNEPAQFREFEVYGAADFAALMLDR